MAILPISGFIEASNFWPIITDTFISEPLPMWSSFICWLKTRSQSEE